MECKTCMFWDTFGYDNKGEELSVCDCYRYPPTPLKKDLHDSYGSPVVYENHWCGEWRAKTKERKISSHNSAKPKPRKRSKVA